jgi:hypothetical protein
MYLLCFLGTSKDELLTMIQHGAEKIYKDAQHTSEEETVTDDIDAILRHGEEKTAELNKKYENYNIDDLKNFSSESAYKWNGEDWSNKVIRWGGGKNQNRATDDISFLLAMLAKSRLRIVLAWAFQAGTKDQLCCG